MDEQFRNLEKLMYTLTDPEHSKKHDCVFVIGKRYAVSYQHEDHSTLELGQKLVIHNLLDKTIKKNVKVFFKSRDIGIITFETTGDYEFDDFSALTRYGMVPRPYHQLGINQENRTPVWTTGTIIERSSRIYLTNNCKTAFT
ncbi:hypothetical protein CAEBREN_02211 [Caenorhabditis brenneri]|uniref:Uncharacterized protein n=1 Tax=Caenorhabditis brenneri TaxID=135651 RepID=G0NE80_CAEBE|nr:hypothetical protein CAEBREN_02211 [Caenorhabditis brenneri]